MGCSVEEKAGVVLVMKDKPLLSELDIKDAAADTRSKEEVFLNPCRFKAHSTTLYITD